MAKDGRPGKAIYWANRVLAGALFCGLVGTTAHYLPSYLKRQKSMESLEQGIWDGKVIIRQLTCPSSKKPSDNYLKSLYLFIETPIGDKGFQIKAYTRDDAEKLDILNSRLVSATLSGSESDSDLEASLVKIRLPMEMSEKNASGYESMRISLSDLLEIDGQKYDGGFK